MAKKIRVVKMDVSFEDFDKEKIVKILYKRRGNRKRCKRNSRRG
ncbi:MAG: hypothetical protein Q6368_010655 [Candidatus Baldrarchaeota archaeon]|nr:hypothetical protein [Candidatus Baldrarchaeota archaeon]